MPSDPYAAGLGHGTWTQEERPVDVLSMAGVIFYFVESGG